jgi:hypothetical protein
MYNNIPIKNVALQAPNVYAQLDSDGVVVSLDTISTAINSTSIIISGGGGFKYCPKQTLLFESSTLPTPVLPYQELFALNPTTSPITYNAPEGYLILYNGGTHPSLTLNSLGQNVTLSIADESNIYFVIAVSGTVTFND